KNTTPPAPARIGTSSCTIAARVAERLLSAVYHSTYPRPDVIMPEASASRIPSVEMSIWLLVSRLTTIARGSHRTELLMFSCNGFPAPRPRREYTPHMIPASAISKEPDTGGDFNPGDTR